MTSLELYLAGARTIREAITDPDVVAAWDELSALEEQTVGSLAGHLARTGTWIVDEFLALEVEDRPVDFTDAAAFYVALLPREDDPIHEGIRARGAALAAEGPEVLAARIDERMPGIEAALEDLPDDHVLTVTGGNLMTLDVYLVTRIIEQVVHLDDLARSVHREPWPIEPEATALVAHTAVEVALLRSEPHTVVRALYRRGFADSVFPAF